LELSVERSGEVANAVVRFYDAIESGTTSAFDRVVSHDAGVMVIGTDRWLGDRDTWRKSFPSLRGVTVERADPQGFRRGNAGWAVDRPVFVLPGGHRLPTRLSAVVNEEADGWKVIHVHISVQVPDEVAIDEAAAWQEATSS
jgi:hypothetical protein